MTDILTPLTLSDPQKTAVQTRFKDVVVTAGAGTGKTRTLVARYLSLLADGLPLRQIVAVTFTRKAAREMRNRVRADIGRFLAQPDLEPQAYKRWQSYQNGLDAARIGTIHNLCSEILRNHPAEAGIDPRFNILDEVQSALLLQETVEATMAWAVQTAASPTNLGDNIRQLFGLLTEGQLQELISVMLYERPSMNALVNNIPADNIYAHWQQQLKEEQASALNQLTTSERWRESVATLQGAAPVNDQDFRVQQRQIVLAAISEAAGKPLDGKLQALSILNEINLRGGSAKAWAHGKDEAEAVKAALGTMRDLWKNAGLLSLTLNSQDEAITAVMPALYALFDHANRSYVAEKTAREALDFDDLEALAVGLLERNTAVRVYWQNQIRALLVDEFQDTNERQRQFIRLLCPEPGKLFIVGDAKQSIYRFRGADVAVFQAERTAIQASGGSAINLDASYRAHEALLGSMNRLLQPVLGDDSPERPSYVAPFDPLVAADKEIISGLIAPFVEFHLALGNKSEALPTAASGLAKRLADLHRNNDIDYGDMAILCRASNAFQYYENALNDAGIPYLTIAGKGFYDRPEVRDLLNALQATADPHDDLALAGFLRSPGCGLSDESLYYLAKERPKNRSLWETVQSGFQLPDDEAQKRLAWATNLLSDLHQLSGRTRVADLLKLFLDKTNYLAALRLAGQPRALRNVAKLLSDVHASELVDVADFLAYAQSLKDSGSREGEARSAIGGAVQIMSIHQAKGLEFPVVVLGDAAYDGPGRDRTILVNPDLGLLLGYKGEDGEKSAAYELGKQLNDQQDAAEIDRLLYVALTRAEQILIISGNGKETKAGMSLSGWLSQLADITGLSACSLNEYDSEGSDSVTFDLDSLETAVSATIYEPRFQPTYSHTETTRLEAQRETFEKVHRTLNLPSFQPPTATDEKKEPPRQVRQVISTAERPQAPASLVGTLVHEAIELWRFPDEAFDNWVRARAGTNGLTDKGQLSHAVKEVGKLLKRFQEWEFFPGINNAERRFHELPYSYQAGSVVETGYIDLLYRHDGRWTIVDFKTDDIRDELEFYSSPAYKKYVAQLMKYETAVIHLLGEHPRLLLCLLNGRDGIITKTIARYD